MVDGETRGPTRLHRDAVALHTLLADLDGDDHATRERLLAARLSLRAEAAALWRAGGWTPITEDRRHARWRFKRVRR